MAEARPERRLAAILAADIAGYSRLMGVDEEGTLAALKTLRKSLIDPKIAEHRGRIVKTTGDGALVEFASAVDAVRCAMEIQHAMAERSIEVTEDHRIEFRIGINVGDIIIDEGDIYGDGVNIAARIESLASPGAICLSDDAYRQIKGKLALDVNDMGEQQLKNIAQPVRVHSVRSVSVATPKLALPDKPSIAVLPFQNMSDDAQQEYFADGVVEDIITALSRIRSLFVIARNSSFTYKGRAVDIRQIGRELGVRYVLEGSVRKGSNGVRVTCQLIDSTNGSHIWSDRYDGDLSDIFRLQDEITQNTVAAIEPNLVSAEIARSKAKPTESLAAYDLYLRALPEFNAFTKEGFEKAEALLRRAVAQDPDYADAWAMLADCTTRQINGGWVRNYDEAVGQSRDAALRAVEADPQNGLVLSIAAFTLGVYSRLFDRATELCERALVLQPNSATVLTNCGWVLVNKGECDRALSYLSLARRLNPLDPRGYITLGAMAAAHFFERRFGEAEKCARQALQINPNAPIPIRFLAASLSAAGRIEEARIVVADLLRRYPTTNLGTSVRIGNLDPVRRQLIIGALREAGLPEEPPLPLPDNPSIAVLPFQNMSGDPEQEYFADGVVEDIITALSRFKNLFVIARNSSFTYKGRAVDIKQVGRELGVRYVLEGSVRKSANRVRITAQLIDSATGAHLWADRFDSALEDIFDLQDRITADVIGAIAPKLEQAEIARAKLKPTASLDAYDSYLRGLARFHEQTKEAQSEGLDHFRLAILADPNFASAYGAAAVCFVRRLTHGWIRNMSEEKGEALRLAQRAVELGKDDAFALASGAQTLAFFGGDLRASVTFLERASSLNPNLAIAWGYLGFVELFLGDHDSAITHFERAMRLSPLDMLNYTSQTGIALAHLFASRFGESATWAGRALSENPNFQPALRAVIASHAWAGEMDQAKKSLERMLQIDPTYNLAKFKERSAPFRPADYAKFADGLRKAGLPE